MRFSRDTYDINTDLKAVLFQWVVSVMIKLYILSYNLEVQRNLKLNGKNKQNQILAVKLAEVTQKTHIIVIYSYVIQLTTWFLKYLQSPAHIYSHMAYK